MQSHKHTSDRPPKDVEAAETSVKKAAKGKTVHVSEYVVEAIPPTDTRMIAELST